ncbi:rRNA-processing endoribonuclease [Tyrophagus putrescentiae]|nr:rRNA-processing endoribonuclease [Tyrophagus putrescentiae]
MSTPLTFEGSNCFRQRIVLATLTGRRIVISRFRDKVGAQYGIADYEVDLLRLLNKVTNGAAFTIDQKGTRVSYRPGLLSGGEVKHNCSLKRAIGYYLETLLPLAPFCKTPLVANLHGVTNDSVDPSVDALRLSALSVLRHSLGGYLDEDALQIKVLARGLKPDGGGHVLFRCPTRRVLKPLQLLAPGKVKRIRGVAYAVRVSPAIANRLVDAAKGLLLHYLPDIYIYTDHLKGAASGRSPGFGLSLVAETTEGVFYVGEAVSRSAKEAATEGGVSVPEEVAKEAAHALLNDIYRGGVVSTANQGLAVLSMAFGDRDLSKVLLGPLSPYTIALLRHLKQFTALTFKLEPFRKELEDEMETDEEDGEKLLTGSRKIVAACIGIGYSNISKTVR